MFVAVAFVLGAVLQCGRVFERQELQTINKRFEARQWLIWSPESLKRLNPQALLDYHLSHDIPLMWTNWDYTLSYLLVNNHPPVRNNIVIFNRMLEDEPPDDAISAFPWMQPLTNYPLPRRTVASMVDFLAESGAAAIILDNDFPQHGDGDEQLAQVIHRWSSGIKGRTVPIFMVETMNSGSDSHVIELGTPTRPTGILAELRKLEPGTNVEDKYLGTTCVTQDSDQVVRGFFVSRDVPVSKGKMLQLKSIVLKALEQLGRPVPADLPEDAIDIDFAAPPRSDIYPVRPLAYLLDPERRAAISKPGGSDVHVKDAIVFIGDGITDVYSTSFTSEGNNQMAGTEILAHAMDTISRGSWPIRLTFMESLGYLLGIAIASAALWVAWKAVQIRWLTRHNTRASRLTRFGEDLILSALMLCSVYFAPCLIFAYTRLLVPMFLPTVVIGFAIIAAIVLEREQEREDRFKIELEAAAEKLTLTQEKYESEIRRREAEAQSREILVDKKRRHEFVRRINHDLNAPVSVLNWTVSELQLMNIQDEKVREKVTRLVKSSDKLCELIDQLVQSYDYEIEPKEDAAHVAVCNLVDIVHDCVDGQVPYATMNGATLDWVNPGQPLWVRLNHLELTRVIDNLIRNAVKHNPEQTRVKVELAQDGRYHILTVSDNGKGIGAEHLERIFEPGYRIEPNPNKGAGQGLGLDIAKTLIEGMGGEIRVSSVVKRGTTFTLRIPVAEQEQSHNGDGNGKHTEHTPKEMVLADNTGFNKRDEYGTNRS